MQAWRVFQIVFPRLRMIGHMLRGARTSGIRPNYTRHSYYTLNDGPAMIGANHVKFAMSWATLELCWGPIGLFTLDSSENTGWIRRNKALSPVELLNPDKWRLYDEERYDAMVCEAMWGILDVDEAPYGFKKEYVGITKVDSRALDILVEDIIQLWRCYIRLMEITQKMENTLTQNTVDYDPAVITKYDKDLTCLRVLKRTAKIDPHIFDHLKKKRADLLHYRNLIHKLIVKMRKSIMETESSETDVMTVIQNLSILGAYSAAQTLEELQIITQPLDSKQISL